MAWWEVYVAEDPWDTLKVLQVGPWFTPHQHMAVGSVWATWWQWQLAEAFGAAFLESARIEGSYVRPLIATSPNGIRRWESRNSWFARNVLLDDVDRRIRQRIVLDCVNDRWTVDIQPRWLVRNSRPRHVISRPP